MAERICSHDGCERKVLGRGFCAPHYSAWHRSQLRYGIVCATCGKQVRVARRKTRHCSHQCGIDAVNASKAGIPVESWRSRPHEQRRSRRWSRAQQKIGKAAGGTRCRTVWVSRTCKICPSRFVTQSSSTGTCCSPECTKANRKNKAHDASAKRRARKRGTYVAPVKRLTIFKRDKYRCHICKRLTNPKKCVPHPRAPTIDHVIPLAKGGTHEPANVATACFECNCLKRDEGGGEQLALIG